MSLYLCSPNACLHDQNHDKVVSGKQRELSPISSLLCTQPPLASPCTKSPNLLEKRQIPKRGKRVCFYFPLNLISCTKEGTSLIYLLGECAYVAISEVFYWPGIRSTHSSLCDLKWCVLVLHGRIRTKCNIKLISFFLILLFFTFVVSLQILSLYHFRYF